MPQYFVLLGGSTGPGEATFGKLAAKIPARRIPEAVERLVSLYLEAREPGEAAGPFFRRAFARAVERIAPLEALTLETVRDDDYVEPGAAEAFQPEAQAGECAA